MEGQYGIRMDVEEIGNNAVNWVDSAQDRDYCECDIEPPGSISHGVSSYQVHILVKVITIVLLK